MTSDSLISHIVHVTFTPIEFLAVREDRKTAMAEVAGNSGRLPDSIRAVHDG